MAGVTTESSDAILDKARIPQNGGPILIEAQKDDLHVHVSMYFCIICPTFPEVK